MSSVDSFCKKNVQTKMYDRVNDRDYLPEVGSPPALCLNL